MAAALRMITEPSTRVRMTSAVTVLAAGKFGHAAAEAIAEWIPARVKLLPIEAPVDAASVEDAGAGTIVVADRWLPELSEQVDAHSFAQGTPWLPLSLANHLLVVGPAVLPRRSACWRCWATRDELGWAAPYAGARQRFNAEHPEGVPQGFLASFATLGALEAARAWQRLTSSGDNAGEVLRIGAFGRASAAAQAIGCDGCSRCGLLRDPATRSYDELQKAMQGLWRAPAARSVD